MKAKELKALKSEMAANLARLRWSTVSKKDRKAHIEKMNAARAKKQAEKLSTG